MSSTLNGQVLSEKLGGHVLVDSLRAHGVEMVFGVPGESYLAVLDGLQDANSCLLYTSPSPRDRYISRMPSSA